MMGGWKDGWVHGWMDGWRVFPLPRRQWKSSVHPGRLESRVLALVEPLVAYGLRASHLISERGLCPNL